VHTVTRFVTHSHLVQLSGTTVFKMTTCSLYFFCVSIMNLQKLEHCSVIEFQEKAKFSRRFMTVSHHLWVIFIY
jgi:hypothetical protein